MQQSQSKSLDQLLKNVRLWDVVKSTFTVAAVVLAALLVYRFFYILFAVVVAIMLYLAIRPLVNRLERLGIARRVGMIVGYLVGVLFIVGFLVLLIPMLLNQARMITEKLPEYYDLIKQLLANSGISLLQILASYLPAELPLDRIPVLLLSVPEPTSDAAAQPIPAAITSGELFSMLFLITAIFAMAYYWMRDRDKIVYQFLLFFPATKRATVEKLIVEMEDKVGAFYQGQLILCSIVGGASFIAYLLVGLPYALTLGAFAFVFEAVPMIGPLLGAIPAILIALTISPAMTAQVVAINMIVQFLENNVLVPRVMDRTVGVNPILTVLAIATFTTLLGLVGALLAVPLAAIIQVLFERTIFHFRPESEADTFAIGSANFQVEQRNHYSVMRVEAQDLANDIRKRMRKPDPEVSTESIKIEEMIESFVVELDQLLATKEENVKKVRR